MKSAVWIAGLFFTSVTHAAFAASSATLVFPDDQTGKIFSINSAGGNQVRIGNDTRGMTIFTLRDAQAVSDLVSFFHGAAGTKNFTIYTQGSNPEDPILKNGDTGKMIYLSQLSYQWAEARHKAANLDHSRVVEGLLCVMNTAKTVWHSMGEDDGIEQDKDRTQTCHAFAHPAASAVSDRSSNPVAVNGAGASTDPAAINVWAAAY